MDRTHLILAASIMMAGCSGSGGDASNEMNNNGGANTQTGVFLDSAVGGINYATETLSGVTNALGEFEYIDGETVTFSIGDIELPAVAAGSVITPLDIAGTESLTDTSVVNMARLLQTLDTDGDATNGITIDAMAHASATGVSADFNSVTFDTDVAVVVTNSGSVTTSLIDEAEATAHLQTTLADNGLSPTLVGSWFISDENKTIVTFINETEYFVTQDIDEIGEPNCSDGMERGTYTWNNLTGEAVFTNVIDTTGDCGFAAVEGEVFTPISVTVNGDVLTVTGIDADVEFTFDLDRIVSDTNPLVGSWFITGDDETVITFLTDAEYYVAQDINLMTDPECADGMEYGTYTRNTVSGDVVLTNIIDTTGNCGLTSTEGQIYNTASFNIVNDGLNIIDTGINIFFDGVR